MRIFILACLLLINFFCFSQHIEWIKNIQYEEETVINSITADADLNIYVCGTFSPSYHSSGSTGFFLQKYDSTGVLLWEDTTVCYMDDDSIRSVATITSVHYYNNCIIIITHCL
jgi:hypothetical protein